jgi:hypothetical protein
MIVVIVSQLLGVGRWAPSRFVDDIRIKKSEPKKSPKKRSTFTTMAARKNKQETKTENKRQGLGG